jgi:Pretoxin HINT domain
VPDPRQTLLLVSNAGTETLSVTASHPVRVAGRGWVPAGDLRPGDSVEAQNGLLQVLATGVDLRVRPVYNLSVENAATYFAGGFEAWVHNQPKGKRFGFPDVFWEWYYRKIKDPGDADFEDIGEAQPYYDDWVCKGKPGPDSKGKSREGKRGKRR